MQKNNYPDYEISTAPQSGKIAVLGIVVFFLLFAFGRASAYSLDVQPTTVTNCTDFSNSANLLLQDNNYAVATSGAIVCYLNLPKEPFATFSSITSIDIKSKGNTTGNSGGNQYFSLSNWGHSLGCGTPTPYKTLTNGLLTIPANPTTCLNFSTLTNPATIQSAGLQVWLGNSGGGRNMNTDSISVTVNGTDMYSITENSRSCDINLPDCWSRFSGNTSYTSSNSICRIWIGQYCTDKITGNNSYSSKIEANIILDSLNPINSSYYYNNTYYGAGYSSTSSAWFADVKTKNISNSNCIYPFSTLCHERELDGTLTTKVINTADINFKNNPPYYSSSSWNYDGSDMVSTSSGILNNPPEESTGIKWLFEKLFGGLMDWAKPPVDSGLDNIDLVLQTLENKVPFAWFNQMQDIQFPSFSSSPSGSIPIEYITFIINGENVNIAYNDVNNIASGVFNSIRNLIIGMLYITLILFFINFIRKIEESH